MCGKSFEIQEDSVTDQIYKTLQVHHFKADSMTLEILGLCSVCQNQHVMCV
jgi:Fe2+ or Zn2+ uptake regulation protein